jgi:hypothetical protein
MVLHVDLSVTVRFFSQQEYLHLLSMLCSNPPAFSQQQAWQQRQANQYILGPRARHPIWRSSGAAWLFPISFCFINCDPSKLLDTVQAWRARPPTWRINDTEWFEPM